MNRWFLTTLKSSSALALIARFRSEAAMQTRWYTVRWLSWLKLSPAIRQQRSPSLNATRPVFDLSTEMAIFQHEFVFAVHSFHTNRFRRVADSFGLKT